MPISLVDFETIATRAVEPARVKAGPRAESKTTVVNTSESSGTKTPADAPFPQPAGDATINARQEKERPLPNDPVLNAESAATKATVEPDVPAEKGGPGPVSPPEKQTVNGVGPELPGTGGDFQNRFDSAQGRIKNQTQSGELQALLDQAIALLDSISQHPAIRDFSATQRKLEEIEQRLGYGAYPQ